MFYLGVRDGVEADADGVRADPHHDVGVVDELPVGVHGVEHDGLVGDLLADGGEEGAAGPRGAARVRRAGHVVEHDGAGALEDVAVALVAGQVDDLVHLEEGGKEML